MIGVITIFYFGMNCLRLSRIFDNGFLTAFTKFSDENIQFDRFFIYVAEVFEGFYLPESKNSLY